MISTVTYRDKTGAKHGKTANCLQFAMLCVAVSFFASGCCQLPQPASDEEVRRAVCTFWRDDGTTKHLMGGGVFVGFTDHGMSRVFCMTARHVVTKSPGVGLPKGFFYYPKIMILAFETKNGLVAYRPQIMPERWMTGSLMEDLAWFELSKDEIDLLNNAGGCIIALGKEIKTALLSSTHEKFIAGTSTVDMETGRQYGLNKGARFGVFLSRQRNKPIREGEKQESPLAPVIGTIINPLQKVSVKGEELGLTVPEITMDQLWCFCRTETGDSGSPVFVPLDFDGKTYMLLAGVMSLRKGAETAVMPIDEAVRMILKGKGARRIIDVPECR